MGTSIHHPHAQRAAGCCKAAVPDVVNSPWSCELKAQSVLGEMVAYRYMGRDSAGRPDAVSGPKGQLKWYRGSFTRLRLLRKQEREALFLFLLQWLFGNQYNEGDRA